MATNDDDTTAFASLEKVERDLRSLLLDEEPRFIEGVPLRAQEIYRALVRNSLLSTTLNGFPIARKLVGEEQATAFVARFLERAPPTTRLLRDVPMQFATWLVDEDAQGRLGAPHPAFAECVHFEAAEVDVIHSPARDKSLVVDDTPQPSSTVVLDPSARLLVYRYDVHKMTTTSAFPAKPRTTPALVFAWRQHERFVWRELSPATATLMARLAEGHAVDASLQAHVDEGGAPIDPGFIMALLVTLQRRGAIVGFTRPARP
jgi:hypothetical protein